jgi:hypothetical protein
MTTSPINLRAPTAAEVREALEKLDRESKALQAKAATPYYDLIDPKIRPAETLKVSEFEIVNPYFDSPQKEPSTPAGMMTVLEAKKEADDRVHNVYKHIISMMERLAQSYVKQAEAVNIFDGLRGERNAQVRALKDAAKMIKGMMDMVFKDHSMEKNLKRLPSLDPNYYAACGADKLYGDNGQAIDPALQAKAGQVYTTKGWVTATPDPFSEQNS